MLIRNLYGNTFHVIYSETRDRKYYIGLCGCLVEKTDLSLQTRADGAYSRCWTCRRIQNDRLRHTRPETFGLAANHRSGLHAK